MQRSNTHDFFSFFFFFFLLGGSRLEANREVRNFWVLDGIFGDSNYTPGVNLHPWVVFKKIIRVLHLAKQDLVGLGLVATWQRLAWQAIIKMSSSTRAAPSNQLSDQYPIKRKRNYPSRRLTKWQKGENLHRMREAGSFSLGFLKSTTQRTITL